MITIVSGLPRSGTSLMMQMLAAGGMTPLTDRTRMADMDNPRGYYEWEAIKKLGGNPAMIGEAEGKAVKIISSLLMHLPLHHDYRIVFMRRPLAQVAASQAEMIRRRESAGASVSLAAMQAALEGHLRAVTAWLGGRSSMAIHNVDYPDLIAAPRKHARDVAGFVGGSLDIERMAAAVDYSLFRIR